VAVYYNENISYAAAWLRCLIANGSLPDGDVDERSIADVTPSDVRKCKQANFFAGIGGWPAAFRLVGRTIVQRGRGRAHVSPSAESERSLDLTTIDTSGPSGETLSPSAVLQRCLENKLRTHLRGSEIC